MNSQIIGHKWDFAEMNKLIESLEDLRHKHPREAEETALDALAKVEFRDAARLLGIIGSCKRSQEHHQAAFRATVLGISIANTLKAKDVLATLLQRVSYIFADDGRYLDAIEATEFSLQLYAICGDLHGVGTTLVDQGIWLNGIGDLEKAIEAQESALRLMDRSAVRSIFSVNQGLAHLHLEMEALDKAEKYALEAMALSDAVGPANQGKVIWVAGRISLARGDKSAGRQYMEQAIDIFLDSSSVDAALVGIELVQILFESGDFQAALAVASSLRRLIGPLGRNRIAASAIAELSNLELSGAALSLSHLKKLQIRIKESRLAITTSQPMVERDGE